MKQKTENNGAAFKVLHERGIFIMPNAWDAGSAKFLASYGFSSLGTTSAGIAYALGYRDSDPKLPQELMFDAIQRIVDAVAIPVSADLENGFGRTQEEIAKTFSRAIHIGCAGGSIEDVDSYETKGKFTLLSLSHAVDRLKVAREVIDRSQTSFVLTGRTDCYLTDHPSPLKETIKRLSAFRDAGADCVFAPGLTTIADIKLIVEEVGIPVNVLIAGKASSFTRDALELAGVRRISTGSAIARAAFAAIKKSSTEMLDGTFTFVNGGVNGDVLDDILEE